MSTPMATAIPKPPKGSAKKKGTTIRTRRTTK